MSSVAIQSSSTTARRWCGLLALVFLTQVLLIFLLSGREETPRRTAPTVTPLLLFPQQLTEAEFAEKFLMSNPALFVSPNVRGFSGPAWLKNPPRNYEKSSSVERTEPPYWLPLDLQQFGNSINQFIQTNAASAPILAETVRPKIQLRKNLENILKPEMSSQLRVGGALASRELLNPPQLQSWAHTNLLSNSVAQVAVDAYGFVLSVRLLSRSGLADADNTALDFARNLQFHPSEQNEVVWGDLTFDWQTVPPIQTNLTSEGLQAK